MQVIMITLVSINWNFHMRSVQQVLPSVKSVTR